MREPSTNIMRIGTNICASMLTNEFDYFLPPELIAQRPADPRDGSRLMVVHKNNRSFDHLKFFNIVDHLRKGDLLVWNNSKVFKARLKGTIRLDERADGINKAQKTTDKIINSSPVEIFLIRPMENRGVWKTLAKPGKRLRLGMKVEFAPDFVAEVMLKEKDGTLLMQFADDDMVVRAKANKYGEVPVPPYIESKMEKGELEKRYQTVYAKTEGSVAAPTAGFHFSPEVIESLERKGVGFAEVTLHVGLGTFLPVKTEKIEDHKMHCEWIEISSKNADLINSAKKEGRRIVAVGTTTVRTLEGAFKEHGEIKVFSGDINLFINPGFKFNVVDAMITNFHLPKSTLLMLVSAFMGDKDFALKCYKEAVREKYRFYSFGDAMFIE